MQTGINIGTSLKGEDVGLVTDAICRIIETRADQETIRHALSTFREMVQVKDISLSDITLTGDRKTVVNVSGDGEISREDPQS